MSNPIGFDFEDAIRAAIRNLLPEGSPHLYEGERHTKFGSRPYKVEGSILPVCKSKDGGLLCEVEELHKYGDGTSGEKRAVFCISIRRV